MWGKESRGGTRRGGGRNRPGSNIFRDKRLIKEREKHMIDRLERWVAAGCARGVDVGVAKQKGES